MVKTKIGFKTWDISYDSPGKIDLPVMEMASKDAKFGFRKKSLDKVKTLTKGKDLSMHTQTKRVFTDKNKILRELEITTLKAEILACSYLGCKELIVHLKQEKLTTQEIKLFSELLKFARKNKVEILYEPNGNFIAKNFLYNLSKFPELNVNLDLCHLGMAVENKTLGMKLNDFLKKVRKKVVYIHASAYDGQEEHHGLDKGKLNWREVLNQLDFSKIKKIIIELHHFEDFKETKKALDDYLKNI